MIKNILYIIKVALNLDKVNFLIVQFLSIISSLLELFAILALASYINFLTFPGKINDNYLIQNIFKIFYNGENFNFVFSLLVILIFFLSSLISIITIWYLNKFSIRIGYFIGEKIFSGYLFQNWQILNKSRDELFNNINEESRRVGGLISAVFQINLNILLSIFLLVSSLIVNFQATLTGVIIFSIIYLIFFKRLQLIAFLLGKEVTELNQKRINLAFQGLENIKEVLIYNLQKNIYINFNKIGERLSKIHAITKMLSQSLKYILNFLIVFLFVILIILLNKFWGTEFKDILPQIIFFALISLKIMPAFNNIYANFINIKGNIPAYNNLKTDIQKFILKNNDKKTNSKSKNIKLFKSLKLINFSFHYKEKNKKKNKIFINSSFEANIGDMIYIDGKSGSGKTTFLEILINLISSNKQKYLIDGNEISKGDNIFNLFSYVPQKTFISAGSIERNITLDSKKIKKNSSSSVRLKKLSNLLGIDHFLTKGQKDLSFNPGDMGIKLSGGQKQRIAIARALYKNPEIVIFDEATSSLDEINEKEIIQNISLLKGLKTSIVIAHKLSILKNCDRVITVKNGSVI